MFRKPFYVEHIIDFMLQSTQSGFEYRNFIIILKSGICINQIIQIILIIGYFPVSIILKISSRFSLRVVHAAGFFF